MAERPVTAAPPAELAARVGALLLQLQAWSLELRHLMLDGNHMGVKKVNCVYLEL